MIENIISEQMIDSELEMVDAKTENNDPYQINVNVLEKRNQYESAKCNNQFRFYFIRLIGGMGRKWIIAVDLNNNNKEKSDFFLDNEEKDSKYYIDPKNIKFFVKHEEGITPADDALNSAFISCFAENMQPITSDKNFKPKFKYNRDDNLNNLEYIVWECFDKKLSNEPQNKNINNFITRCNLCDTDCKRNEDTFLEEIDSAFEPLNEKDKKTVMEFIIQYMFFNMFDRLRNGNTVIRDSKIIHLDTQRHEDEEKNDGFLFSLDSEVNKSKKKSFKVFFRFCCYNDKRMELAEEALNKCSNIDYDIFLNRYIRNCIFLDVTPVDALKNLRIFFKRMKRFYEKQQHLTEVKSELKETFKQNAEIAKKYFKNWENVHDVKNLVERCDRLTKLDEILNKAAKNTLSKFNTSEVKKNIFDYNENKSLEWIKNKYKTIIDEILRLNKENNFTNDKKILCFNINDKSHSKDFIKIDENSENREENSNDLFSSFKTKCIKTCVDAFCKICGCKNNLE